MPAVLSQSNKFVASLALVLAVLAILFAVALRSTPCALAASGSCSVGDNETFASGITVNEDGDDSDTRFEGDTNANLLYLDSGNDRIGIGTASPASLFDVNGALTATTIDGMIGSVTPAAGTFTALVGTSLSVSDNNITNVADIALDSITADDGSTISVTDDTFWANGTGVVIGHTAQAAANGTVSEFQVLGTGNQDSSLIIGRWSNDSTGPRQWFVKSRDAAIYDGTYTIVQNGDILGETLWAVDDGVDTVSVAGVFQLIQDAVPAGNQLDGTFIWKTANNASTATERMRLGSTGALSFTVGSDPSTIANQAHIYSKDVASSAEVFVRDEAGNVTPISPHNGDTWYFESCNDYSGKCVSIDMEAVLSALETLTGQDLITITYSTPKITWEDDQTRLVAESTATAQAWDEIPIDQKTGDRPVVITAESKPQWLIDSLAKPRKNEVSKKVKP